jgi:hypothetical protein
VARRVGLLAAVTPINAAAERARLIEDVERGRPSLPRWRYAAVDLAGARGARSARAALRVDVERLGHELAARAGDALARLYVARADELARELEMVDRVGAPEFGALAERRFPIDRSEAIAAIGRRFSRGSIGPASASDRSHEAARDCTSDGPEPTSLVSRVRARVGELRLAFRVEVRADLVPMAATGENVVLVAAGRRLTDEAARRIAMHEVMGHAVPRARAARQALGLFALGTAGGTDEQEGFALVLEERAGHLEGARARELAARHETVRAMRQGADFVEATRRAMADHGLDAASAVSVAERAYRGGDGTRAGLGREAVYLPAFARVRAHLDAHPEDEIVLASGQIAVSAVPTLRAHVVA